MPQRGGEWSKPNRDFLKCNVSSSWISARKNCGSAWLLRDWSGRTLFHSRRSYSQIGTQLEAELVNFLWEIESVSTLHFRKIIFESMPDHAANAIHHPTMFATGNTERVDCFRRLEAKPYLVKWEPTSDGAGSKCNQGPSLSILYREKGSTLAPKPSQIGCQCLTEHMNLRCSVFFI